MSDIPFRYWLAHRVSFDLLRAAAREMSLEDGALFLAALDAKLFGVAFNYDKLLALLVADQEEILALMWKLAHDPAARNDLLREAKEKYKP